MFGVLFSFVLAIASSIEYCTNQALDICLLNIFLYFTEDITYFRNGIYNFRKWRLGHNSPSCISKICRGTPGTLDVQLKEKLFITFMHVIHFTVGAPSCIFFLFLSCNVWLFIHQNKASQILFLYEAILDEMISIMNFFSLLFLNFDFCLVAYNLVLCHTSLCLLLSSLFLSFFPAIHGL